MGHHTGLVARAVLPQDGLSDETAMFTDRMGDVLDLQQRLDNHGYIAERSLAATLLLTMEMRRPLLLEGEAGVGKTEVAKALTRLSETRLIRLQCYEGLDVHSAMYEWNYQRQLLAIKLLEQDERPMPDKEQDIFSERYLLKRPLLEAITTSPAPVLLIDEIDRTDEAFEAYLLELLSDFQISIPELGVIRAVERPVVILTSNGTREISDALRRRCLYHYVDYPNFDKELAIVHAQAPEVPARLAQQVVEFVQAIRQMDIRKKPGVAETLDWAAALLRLGVSSFDADGIDRIMDSLSTLVKTREDQAGLTRPVVEKLAAAC
jgi:MoxR-like ATPase